MNRAMTLANPRARFERFVRAARDLMHVAEARCVRCLTNEQTPDSFWCDTCREC